MNRKHDHPRLYLIKYVGESEIFIPCMNVAQAIADFYFRRENKTFKKEIEANAKLRAKIIFFDLHQFFRFFCAGIGSHVNVKFKTRHDIHPEIADPVGLKF